MKVLSYLLSLVEPRPRFCFSGAILASIGTLLNPLISMGAIFLGHFAWWEMNFAQRDDAKKRLPWIISILFVGYWRLITGLITESNRPGNDFMRDLTSMLNGYHERNPAATNMIFGLILLAFMVTAGRMVICWLIKTNKIIQLLESFGSSAQSEIRSLQQQSKDSLTKLDELKREIAAANTALKRLQETVTPPH